MQCDKEYETLVDECFYRSKTTRIANGLPMHARYLMYRLFLLANHKVRLYSGSLPDQFKDVDVYAWGKLQSAVATFLKPESSKLEILVEDGSQVKDCSLISFLRDQGLLEKVTVKTLEKERLPAKGAHFMTSDEIGFRFENDVNNCKAEASANDPEITKLLAQEFDYFFKQLPSVSLS